MPSLKLACVNIERSKHLARVEAFLSREVPDVVCLQEVCAHDVEYFETMFEGHFVWVPMCYGKWEEYDELVVMGVGMGSRHGLKDVHVQYYHGTDEPLPKLAWTADGREVIRESISHALLSATVEVGGAAYRIGTTHLTWTKDGLSTPGQREDAAQLLLAADRAGVGVLCGDFNAPRGKETWAMLAAAMQDNIPPQYTSSIDGTLHRAGDLGLMVDGVFTAPGYTAENVRLVGGVSDHMAVSADIFC